MCIGQVIYSTHPLGDMHFLKVSFELSLLLLKEPVRSLGCLRVLHKPCDCVENTASPQDYVGLR